MRSHFFYCSLLLLPVAAGCGSGKSSAENTAHPTAGTSTAATTNLSAATTQSLEDRLYGTWVANDVDVKIGQVKIKLTFHQDGPVRIAAWSDIPFVGQVRNKKAPYDVHDHTIHSDAIRGGSTVKYHFEGDQLVIQYKQGKTIRFTRLK
jgi:hypothetical protein